MKEINVAAGVKNFSLVIIVSRFNQAITGKLLAGAKERCKEKNIIDVTVIHVPGAVEIPLAAQACAVAEKYDAIIALGAVIRGETSHYDYVCQQVSRGCQEVMLNFSIPVIFGVLTTDNDSQAEDRAGGKHGNKGRDAVDAACEMVAVMRKIEE